MSAAAVHITLEEFLARPEREDDQREELIEGELIVSPGAKVPHAAIVRSLRLGLILLEQQGYVLSNDFSCILGERSMPVPDLAAIQQQRREKAIDDDNFADRFARTGDRSLVTQQPKLQRKADIYLEHGAEQVWIVHPKTKTVTVVTPEARTEARVGHVLELHGVSVPVALIFQRIRQ